MNVPSAVLAGISGTASDGNCICDIGLLDAVVLEEEEGRRTLKASGHCRIVDLRSRATKTIFRALRASVGLIDSQ